jgi:ABC-type amino acid transport system permease subunit
MLTWLSPFRFALALTAFDGFWAVQAMTVTRVHAVSNVELLSLILWCYFHLPAALLASALFKPLGWLPADPQQMPVAALFVLAALGLAQTFALAYLAWRWWLRPSPVAA